MGGIRLVRVTVIMLNRVVFNKLSYPPRVPKSRRIVTMAKKTGRVATADSYDNFVARVGMQQPNQHAASTYRANYTSRNRLLIEWAYRSSGLLAPQSIRKRTI